MHLPLQHATIYLTVQDTWDQSEHAEEARAAEASAAVLAAEEARATEAAAADAAVLAAAEARATEAAAADAAVLPAEEARATEAAAADAAVLAAAEAPHAAEETAVAGNLYPVAASTSASDHGSKLPLEESSSLPASRPSYDNFQPSPSTNLASPSLSASLPSPDPTLEGLSKNEQIKLVLQETERSHVPDPPPSPTETVMNLETGSLDEDFLAPAHTYGSTPDMSTPDLSASSEPPTGPLFLEDPVVLMNGKPLRIARPADEDLTRDWVSTPLLAAKPSISLDPRGGNVQSRHRWRESAEKNATKSPTAAPTAVPLTQTGQGSVTDGSGGELEVFDVRPAPSPPPQRKV